MKKLTIITLILTILIFSINVLAEETFEDFLKDTEEQNYHQNGVSHIQDSNAVHHFPNINNIQSINLEIKNNKNEEFSQEETSDINKILTNYNSQSLNIQSIYEKRDYGLFNTNQRPIKQAYILTNNLNKKQKVVFTINHEVTSNEVEWNGEIYQINNKPQYFEASTIKHHLKEDRTELIGHTIYFGDVYYDFKDIINLNYKVYIHSKDNKNYITVEIGKTLGPKEEFLIDPEIGWVKNEIASDPVIWGPIYGNIADLDNDGDEDFAMVAWNGMNDRVVWFENDGNYPLNWTEHVITTNIDSPNSLNSADIDGDGDLDLVSAILRDDRVEWYENDGNQPANFFVRYLATNLYLVNYAHPLDIDNDGDIDIVVSVGGENRIVLYENDGNITPSWTESNISTDVYGSWGVNSADVDNDGDLDIIGNAKFDGELVWFENNNMGSWNRSIIYNNLNRPNSIFTKDIDQDGDMDILSSIENDDRIALFLHNGNFASPLWNEMNVSTNVNLPASAKTADIDNDGDLDVISTSWDDKKIAWHEYKNGAWNEHIVTVTAGYGGGIWADAADLDQDNDTDIIGLSGYYTSSMAAFYESNETQTDSVCGPLYGDLTLKNNVNSTSTCFTIKRSDITLDCDGYTISGFGTNNGVHFNGNSGTTIKNCNIEDFRAGVYIKRTRYITVENSTITNNKVGIFIEESENATVTNNIIEDNSFVGIYFRPNTQYHNVSENRVCNNIRYDIAQANNNPSNFGFANTCQFPLRWEDEGMSNSCSFACI